VGCRLTSARAAEGPSGRAQGQAPGAALRRAFRDLGRGRTGIGFAHGLRRHHLQAARRALPIGPRRKLAQDQVSRRPGGGGRGLDQRSQEGELAAGWGPSRQEAGLCGQGRHRLWRRGDSQTAAQAQGARKQGQPRSPPAPARPGNAAFIGHGPSWWPRSSSPAGPMAATCGRPPSRGCARTSRPTRVVAETPVKVTEAKMAKPVAQDNDAQDSDSQDCERQGVRAGGHHGRVDLAPRQALVARREAAGHQARARPLLRGDRRLDDRSHQGPAVLAGAQRPTASAADLLPAPRHAGAVPISWRR